MSQPKPTRQHKRDGTYQKCRHEGRMDATWPNAVPAPPEGLSAQARSVWSQIVDCMPDGVLAAADGFAIEGMCRWFLHWRNKMQESDDTEGKEAYMALMEAAMAWKHFAHFASRFGFTPADRARIKQINSQPEQVDPLVEMMQRRVQAN